MMLSMKIFFQPSGVQDFDSYAIPLFWFLLHLYFMGAQKRKTGKKKHIKQPTTTPTTCKS